MLEVLIFVLVGVLLGTFTGLAPGIHVNTVVVVVLSMLPLLLEKFSVTSVVALIVAMSITHTFVDYIPSILLGAPMEDSVLSVLPGHRLLLQGYGFEAIRLTVLGGVGAVAAACAFLPIGLAVLPFIYPAARQAMPFLLSLVLLYMIYTERSTNRRAYSILVVLYAGFLGYTVLNQGMLQPKYALFPVLTGLFGIPTLMISLRAKARIPKQEMIYSKRPYLRGIALGSIGGMLTGLLPGIGSSQSALIVKDLLGRDDDKEFLVVLGGVNTADAIYAFLALYLIGTPRSGASIAVEQILGEIAFADLLSITSVTLLTTFFAAGITILLARRFVAGIQNVEYSLFSKITLAFLASLILLLTGWKGVLIACVATAIGMVPPLAGIKRSHCMAVLILPTILYFL